MKCDNAENEDIGIFLRSYNMSCYVIYECANNSQITAQEEHLIFVHFVQTNI